MSGTAQGAWFLWTVLLIIGGRFICEICRGAEFGVWSHRVTGSCSDINTDPVMFSRKKKQVAEPSKAVLNGHSDQVGIFWRILMSWMSLTFSIPMMDLLVNLAAGSRLNPAGHTLQVLNEETGKLKEYKANQTIGSLCTRGDDHRLLGVTVQIVPKKDSKKSTHLRNAQPFEVRCLCHPAPQRLKMRSAVVSYNGWQLHGIFYHVYIHVYNKLHSSTKPPLWIFFMYLSFMYDLEWITLWLKSNSIYCGKILKI